MTPGRESIVLLSEPDLERALAAAGLSAPVRADEVTGSTNQTALTLAAEGAPEWTLVAAGHQTTGRGRLGRSWEDLPGRAVLFSLVLRPSSLPLDVIGLLPLLAGASLASATREVAGLEVGCKWPNDILLDEAKVGGILVESRVAFTGVAYAVVGVGVNLEAPEGLEGAGGIGEVDPVALLSRFLRTFREGYEAPPSTFARRVVEAYAERCLTIGREVEATRVDGERVRGRATSVATDGSLVLETAEGPALVAFGEVVHIR